MSLFQFINHLEYNQIPPKTRDIIQHSLIDIIGILAGASENDTSKKIRNYAHQHYSISPSSLLSSRLFFDGRAIHPLGAAWAGGFSADSLDAHEGHFTSKGHAGATVLPAVLILIDAYLNQGKNISGEELITTLAIAYETSLRAGASLMDSTSEYHASGAFSSFGVVCAGARLLKLDEETFNHALGISEYFSPRCPMMRLVDFPSMLRDAHGAGAYAGINAILLSQSGITGSPSHTATSNNLQQHWQQLGQSWEIDNQYFKPWPVCRWAQPALTAVSEILKQNPAISPENIEEITIATFHESMRLQGHNPRNADEAQYALAFPVAALISKGQLGPNEVTGQAIFDKDILAISNRINITEASDLSQRFPEEILSRVTFKLKYGATITSSTTQAKGDPETAMNIDDIKEKFCLIASTRLNTQQIQNLLSVIENITNQTSCEQLLNLVTTR